MAQANVSRARAVRALRDNQSDIVNAIMVSGRPSSAPCCWPYRAPPQPALSPLSAGAHHVARSASTAQLRPCPRLHCSINRCLHTASTLAPLCWACALAKRDLWRAEGRRRFLRPSVQIVPEGGSLAPHGGCGLPVAPETGSPLPTMSPEGGIRPVTPGGGGGPSSPTPTVSTVPTLPRDGEQAPSCGPSLGLGAGFGKELPRLSG